jgi:hypothetical protein
MHQSKPTSDDATVFEKRTYLFWRAIGRNIEILGLFIQQ